MSVTLWMQANTDPFHCVSLPYIWVENAPSYTHLINIVYDYALLEPALMNPFIIMTGRYIVVHCVSLTNICAYKQCTDSFFHIWWSPIRSRLHHYCLYIVLSSHINCVPFVQHYSQLCKLTWSYAIHKGVDKGS